MTTLRIEVMYFVDNKDTNSKVANCIIFYKNKNKTPLRSLDRHHREQFDKALELIINKDYDTILALAFRDLKGPFKQVEVLEAIVNP